VQDTVGVASGEVLRVHSLAEGELPGERPIPGRIPASSQTRSVWASSACGRLCQPPGKNPK
jgi:hypothetical protein